MRVGAEWSEAVKVVRVCACVYVCGVRRGGAERSAETASFPCVATLATAAVSYFLPPRVRVRNRVTVTVRVRSRVRVRNRVTVTVRVRSRVRVRVRVKG